MNRSKSTVPFNEHSTDDFDNCYLIADVDEDSYEYVHENHLRFSQDGKPSVGVTPHTRFRRAPTLDIIRSTNMPVNNTASNNKVEVSHVPRMSQPFYLRKSRDLFMSRKYFSNGELNNNRVAKF